MALVTLQTIFQDAFPAYEQTHPLPTHIRKAARAITLFLCHYTLTRVAVESEHAMESTPPFAAAA